VITFCGTITVNNKNLSAIYSSGRYNKHTIS